MAPFGKNCFFFFSSVLLLSVFQRFVSSHDLGKEADGQARNLFINYGANAIDNVDDLTMLWNAGVVAAANEMYKQSVPERVPTIPSFNKPNDESLRTGLTGLANSFALKLANELLHGSNFTVDAAGHCVPVSGFCKPAKECSPIEPQVSAACSSKKQFRNEDGSCHDLKKPNLGMAGTTQLRLTPNRYSDGCDLPRAYSLANTNKCLPLPDPRLVSTSLSKSVQTADKQVSLLMTTFGQFVDHDLTFTPVFHQKHLGKPAQPLCCPDSTSSECAAIPVSEFDDFYSDYGVTCLEFVRSLATTTDPTCGLGVRLQINQNSHWLDGSQIYGSGKTSPDVRYYDNGALDHIFIDNADVSIKAHFPPVSDVKRCRKQVTVNAPCEDHECCVTAGDLRAGEQPPLTSMHTLWLRQHNLLADMISLKYDSLTDEQIYQLARKILVAQYQYVVFKELLPEIVGDRRMELYGLRVLNNSEYLPTAKYQPGIGKILLEFSTAAGRFGHSLLHDQIFKNASPFSLSDHLNRIDLALGDHKEVGNILKGQCSHAALKMDQQLTGEIQNKLFKNASPFGGDLFATNVQRGRDHGIGTYYDLRSFCLGDVSVDPSWESPVWDNVFLPGAFNTLKKLYKTPLDVDLFAGGISEKPDPENEGLVGPTFGCIIAKQFQHLKYGDRFWFEFENLINGDSQFSPEQLRQIRKTTLARLMCDLTDITSIQRQVLRMSNTTVQCDDPKFQKETNVDYDILITNDSI